MAEVNTDSSGQDKISVLFLCNGNSCRSQIAEGYARALKGDTIEASSAGTEARGVDPLAIKVMREVGIDIGRQSSKTTESLKGSVFDYVVTLCEDDDSRCPYFPARLGAIHRGFEDPPKCAKKAATGEEKIDCYRRVRDEIRVFIETMPESLSKKPGVIMGEY